MDKKQKYFIVTAKCGHVGRNKYIEKDLTIIASSGKEAALKGRQYPRVKHDWKYAITNVVEVTEEIYWKVRVQNYYDPYFSVKNIKEQKQYCSSMHANVKYIEKEEYPKEKRRQRIKYLLKKNAILDQYNISC